ncbi:hypothetical protein R1sor_002585 [Riccia sorocarpa]|uniref:FAD-binding FR-type domain-containing protein n=1 Tax=Riccia sorocarpa TaxID=122646 RepID=A0ABD3H022_9MARC
MSISMAMPWNDGEEKMQRLLHVPLQDNPTSTFLTHQASFLLQRAPLLAFGTLDSQFRPWSTLWGGEPGFSEPLGGDFLDTRTLVDGKNDPVVQALVGDAEIGETSHPKDSGKLVAGLTIDLMTRKRVKLAGRMITGTVKDVGIEVQSESEMTQQQLQLVTKIDQSMGNCPKYLNQYEISPAIVNSRLVSQGPELTDEGRALISKSDMFFLSTSVEDDMDVNHRGGPPGFVRIISSNQIVYPEYSGNRLYQSLGNLQLNPKIGMTFPDYETGDVLYLTGTTEILISTDASTLLPGSNLAVKITINEAHFVAGGLPFRGVRKTPSPYNPLVRKLTSEGNIKASLKSQKTARLVRKELITPSIARFTFSIPEGIKYEAGQWVAMDFKQWLDRGYQHMRNEDPTSLNDDFVRTFTISSAPKLNGAEEKEFEITIRKVGPVTQYLVQQNEQAGFEVLILGVGGEFKMKQEKNSVTPFIAGGVGITPLLGQLSTLEISPDRFKLFWTVRASDVGMVTDTFKRQPELGKCTEVFFTGNITADDSTAIGKVIFSGATTVNRRLTKSDLDGIEAQRWVRRHTPMAR